MSSDPKAVDVGPDPFGHWPDNPLVELPPEEIDEQVKAHGVPVVGLAIIQDQPACKRTGMCCEHVLLSVSPSQLRRDYELWVNNSITYGQARFTDVHVIFPMLEGRCRGKWRNPHDKSLHYVYGPCKNLTHEMIERDGEQVRVAGCSIHAHRPGLCRNYPYYRSTRALEMGATPENANPGYMQGCGYNAQADAGWAPQTFDTLEPLTDAEK